MTVIVNTTKELIERKATNAVQGNMQSAIDLTFDNQVVIVSKYSKGYRSIGLKVPHFRRAEIKQMIEELNTKLFNLSPIEAEVMAIQAL